MEQRVFIADFETRAGKQAELEQKTWVWGWSCTELGELETVETGSTLSSFMEHLLSLGNVRVYFHNLKWDGKFILDWLFRHGYEHVKERKEFRTNKRAFMTLIDDMGVFYSITLHGGKYREKIEIFDSMKLAPFSVEKLGKDFRTKYRKTSIDYVEDRPEGYKPTSEELEYMKNDVRVVSEVLESFVAEGYEKMTIGSNALDVYKQMLGKKKFNDFFPQLSQHEDSFVRKAYKGGWCYVAEWARCRTFTDKGNTYDVNSLYPSMMSSTPYDMYGEVVQNDYPMYRGVYYTGKYTYDRICPLYVQHIKASFKVKDGYLPTIQLKNSFRFAANEYIVNSDGVEDLYLTCVDLEVFLRHYETSYIEYIDGYKYVSARGLFDVYIDHFMKVKKTEKGAKRAIAKLFLNNLYGKFAQTIETASKIPYLDPEKNRVRYTTTEKETRKAVYVPVGAFCTAYARRFTIYHAQENYHPETGTGFCYADTDSIHMIGEAVNLKIHPTDLCCWAHESTWDKGRFVRQKTYMEHVIEQDEQPIEPHWDVKCAGMPQNVKDVFIAELESGEKQPGDFGVGLVYHDLKLKPATVEGGVLLVPVKFEINA